MTPIPPPTPNPSNSECNNLITILCREDMNSTINTNVPKVDYLLKGSKTLRNRTEDQTDASCSKYQNRNLKTITECDEIGI